MLKKPNSICEIRQLDDLLLADAASLFILPENYLRALILIEVGARRWRLGLTSLGRRTYLMRDTIEIMDLERWGFVVDVPDDWRWLYYLAPSPLGRVQLRCHPDAVYLRAEILAGDIDGNEAAEL